MSNNTNPQLTLEQYKENLVDLARTKSDSLFQNGGKEYASILMSVLFAYTTDKVRIFCNGFRPNLITTQPYWNALIEYLKDDKKEICVLVESDEAKEELPMRLLRRVKERRINKDSISVKLINSEGRKIISEQVIEDYCNFAIFDEDKFRFEYEPKDFKAFGSFNRPSTCRFLSDIFDKAFNTSKTILV